MEENTMPQEETILPENPAEIPTETPSETNLALKEMQDKYLRLLADFENHKKRTAKEKLETIQTAGKNIIYSLLEVLDDCDRAEKQINNGEKGAEALTGTLLVFNKLRSILQQKGLVAMESIGMDFNPDIHEAITEIDGPENMKGKVMDELNKGYKLNEVIIRHAKVVVGK